MSARLRLAGATVIDGLGGDPVRADVLLEGGRIAAVGTNGTAGGAETIDVSGLTLLPGLIDAHTHLGIVDNKVPGTPPAIVLGHIARNCARALEAGFTTVRDVGGLDGGMARAIAEGLFAGPRVLPVGPIICEVGGNGDLEPACSCSGARWNQGLPGLSVIGAPCRGPDEVRAAARMALRRGASQVKVSLNTLQALEGGSSPETEFTVDEVRAAVLEARAKGTYVTAHALNSHGVRIGLEAGVECLEHGGIADEEIANAVAQAGIPLVPTLSMQWLIEHREVHAEGDADAAVAYAGSSGREMRDSLVLARAHGIRVGLGSDLEGVDQVRRGLELVLRAEVESPMDAIVAATSVNAQIIRRPDLGRIEPGTTADLVAFAGDPLSDPAIFDDPERVRLVVQGGSIVKRA
jgi:imidazolonepropionase-like amidohydrolase